MKYGKAAAALFLALAVLSMSACGAKTNTGAESEDGGVEVEVDFDNVSVDSTSSAEQTPSAVLASSIADSSKTDTEEGSDTESDDEDDTSSYVRREIEGEPIDLAWFDDCVFMGDSLTNGLGLYNDYTECLGNAQFVCGASLGWVNSQWDLFDENEVHPVYNGQKMLLEDAAVVTGASKAIIGLGMNDIGIYGIDYTIEAAGEFLDKFREKSPDVEIYLMTVTPMIASAEYDRLNNPKIQEYDQRLEEFAAEQGCRFLNTWSALANDDGKLPDELCEDPNALGLHLTNEGCEILKDYIMCNVG